MKRTFIILLLLQLGCGSRQRQLQRQQSKYSRLDSSAALLQQRSSDSLFRLGQSGRELWLWLRGGFSYHVDSGLKAGEAMLYLRDSSSLLVRQGSSRARDSTATALARRDSSRHEMTEERLSEPMTGPPWWFWLAGLALVPWLAIRLWVNKW